MDEQFNPAPPTPPPEPVVIFEPPLYLQRRRAVHELLRQLSSSNIFDKKGFKSILDVGCGTDLLMLRSLMPCDDDLPLEHLTGIDMDDGLLSKDLIESLAPGPDEEEERWRELTVRLLHGSFEELSPEIVPRHDVIVSTEVIEHLDPIPLANYAPVLLGKMRPKVCIITTPNRDFNKVFDSALPHDPTRRHFRPEISYAMRHHDHRFEWTRAEFRTWAKEAADRWGYRVVFSGVGSFDCGVVCDDPRIRDFLMKSTDEFTGDPEDNFDAVVTSGDSKLGDGLCDIFGEPLLTSSYLSQAKKSLGSCTQIAIFMLKRQEPGTALDSSVFPQYWNTLPMNDLMLVCRHAYPWAQNEVYPPPCSAMLEMVQATFSSFMPALVATAWENIGKPLSRPEPRYDDFYDYEDYHNGSPPSADELLERRQARRLAELKEKERMKELISDMAGMNPEDVDAVRVMVTPQEVWKRSWVLQRAFRFHSNVFQKMLMSSGELGVKELSARNSDEDMTSANGGPDTKWKTIFTSPTRTLQLHIASPPGDKELALVKLTINGPGSSPVTVTVTRAPSAPDTPEDVQLPEEVMLQEETLYEGDASLEGAASENLDADHPCRALTDDGPYDYGSVYSEPTHDNPHRLHTVAVWALDYNSFDDNSMDVEVVDETRMLKVPNKQTIDHLDGKIVLTFFKPVEMVDFWGMPCGSYNAVDNEEGAFDPNYHGSPRWEESLSGGEGDYGCLSSAEDGGSWSAEGSCILKDGWEI